MTYFQDNIKLMKLKRAVQNSLDTRVQNRHIITGQSAARRNFIIIR